jgi:hypothetical protein
VTARDIGTLDVSKKQVCDNPDDVLTARRDRLSAIFKFLKISMTFSAFIRAACHRDSYFFLILLTLARILA